MTRNGAERSFLARLNPRTKVPATLILAAGLVATRSWIGFVVYGAVLLGLAVSGRISVVRLVKAVQGVSLLLFFTVVVNALFTPGEVWLQWGPVTVTVQGMQRGLLLGLRLAMLVGFTTLLTASTEPLALAEGFEALMAPLRIIGVPTMEFAMVASIALRFVPILLAEARRIHAAQRARGIDPTKRVPLARVVSLGPVLIPLFAGALRRADELGDALEARGYQPGQARGSLHPRGMRGVDWAALLLSVMMAATAWRWL